jgi:MarR family transcriptional regulator, organic hydroperoxide resistance regulator
MSEPTAGFLVWRLATRWRVAVDRALAPLGLTHAQYAVLASLSALAAQGRRPSQRALAEHTGLEPLYVSKLCRALSAAGLVDRAGDPADSRAVRLSLTPAGVAVVARAVPVVRELVDRLLAPLGPGRTGAFVRELQLLLAAPLTLEDQ